MREISGARKNGKLSRNFAAGGDSGIGQAVAVHFAREGCDVAIVYHQSDASAEAINAGLEDLRQAAKYGGLWGTRAEGMLFKRERLQIGMVAPDIVGPDIDGVEFRLSDYRGKVVVIDFWGDW